MKVNINISISSEEYLKYYKVPSASVSTRSSDGRSVRFPASILQPFVSHTGIQGSFCIEFSSDGKFKNIERL
ncbi:MAG: hypothetical protein ACI92E_000828 [Oceanicoccus sp.]